MRSSLTASSADSTFSSEEVFAQLEETSDAFYGPLEMGERDSGDGDSDHGDGDHGDGDHGDGDLCDKEGYLHLVNVYKQAHKEKLDPPPQIQNMRDSLKSAKSTRFSMSMRAPKEELDPPPQIQNMRDSLMSSNSTRFNMAMRAPKEELDPPPQIQNMRDSLKSSAKNTRFSMSMRELTLDSPLHVLSNPDDSQDEICISETIRSIVDNDFSWHQIKKQMTDARLVTSLGIHEVCSGFIRNKADELRVERKKEKNMLRESQLSKSQLSKLRKRLSIFG